MKVVSIQQVWQLTAGSHLVIYAKDNPAALSIAEAAFALGLKVTLIMSGANPFASLPSWKYLNRSAMRRGIEVIDQDARLIRVDEQGISFELGSKISTVSYDHILIASKPEPFLVEIDGHVPSALDVDLTTGAFSGRSDIYLVGDAAGFLTAAEAEEHSRLVARGIGLGRPVDIEALEDIPTSFHGPSPLAMVGKPWSWNVTAKRWIEIDFRQIGWTKVYGHDGKLWYLPGEKEGHVDAIHICHPLANELIAIARLLLARPISDSAWRTATVHPSAAEIFKLVR
jgi:dihydrolipoamide dehydrogenase